MTHYILIDVSFLAHRALHSVGHVGKGGKHTEILFGLMKACEIIRQTFPNGTQAFFFDGGYDYRKSILPEYKQHRRLVEKSPEEQEALKSMHKQLACFRDEAMLYMGVVNHFYQQGVEADDLIASAIHSMHFEDSATIISSDQDLWQLLKCSKVQMWNITTHKYMTEDKLFTEYGVTPCQWAAVKAYAGCSVDGIPGLPRVGDKTAAKYVSGRKVRETLFANAQETYDRNIQLTRLPCPDTSPCVLRSQSVQINWNVLAAAIGEAPATPPKGIKPK